jgi:protein tyrosine/serine phosphatase
MRLFCFVFTLSLTLSSYAAPADTAIPHFSKVNNSLYRGGRPQPADLRYLRSLNVRTVINLQGGDLNNPRYRAFMEWWEPGERADAIASEMNLSESLGLLFFSKPLDAIDPLSDEDDARIDQILAIMDDRAAQPVFVHCEHGVDRTGLIIALYEVKYMGMSPHAAYNEWRATGHKGIGALFTGHLDEYYWRKLGLSDPRASNLRDSPARRFNLVPGGR